MDKRTWCGAIVTTLWMLGMFVFLTLHWDKATEMKPNEWGDFFAGFLSPLAFLWLVLGYLQQGQELQLSTKALLLQAEELKNSVNQQRELVEVTRQQVESERTALAAERLDRKKAAKPLFIPEFKPFPFTPGTPKSFTINLKNQGNHASHVKVTCSELPGKTLAEYPSFEKGGAKAFNVVLPIGMSLPLSSVLHISYSDADDEQGCSKFSITESNEPYHLIIFSPIREENTQPA